MFICAERRHGAQHAFPTRRSSDLRLIRSLEEQTYQNFQLIIVDDGSDDDSVIIGQKMKEEGKIDLFLRNDQRGGKASAANLALRYATGKYVGHLDADSSLHRDAIESVTIPFCNEA